MVKVNKEILNDIAQTFISIDQEQGFLLGCTTCLEQLDHCCFLPAVQAGKFYYIPDSKAADCVIKNWAARSICFCGFIHSHLSDKKDLSESDIEFAQKLFESYPLPVLWFGIGIVNEDGVIFRFYAVSKIDGVMSVSPIEAEALYF